MKIIAAVVLMPVFALLAGCGDDPVPATAEGGAEGEVLEGTISDAMLPLDTVQSEGPKQGGEEEDSADGSEAEAGSVDGDTAEEPAE